MGKKIFKILIKKLLIKVMAIIVPLLLLIIIVFSSVIILLEGQKNNSSIVSTGNANVSSKVLAWKSDVEKYATQFGIAQYENLILAVIQQESGGTSIDVMQSSEGPYNKNYPKMPNGITDPDYSIFCGVQELKDVLTKAGVVNASDIKGISLALQSYNFGDGFIGFAKSKGGYSLPIAQEFSSIQAQKMGWSSYGDTSYVAHVLKYYTSTSTAINTITDGSGQLAKVIQIAQSKEGKSYIWGAVGPNTFDCSGFVFYCYKNSGYKITRQTAQGYYDKATKTTTPAIGDLVFFGVPSNIHHIGMYIGNNEMIDAPQTGDVVKIQSYERSDFAGFGKYNN